MLGWPGAAIPGTKRRSKVIRVSSSFDPESCDPAASDLASPVTWQASLGAVRRLVSYLQDWVLPSPDRVTVTFSHHGELDTRAGVWVADVAARTKAASLSTTRTPSRPAASGDPIAAATCQPQRAITHLVSTVRDRPFGANSRRAGNQARGTAAPPCTLR